MNKAFLHGAALACAAVVGCQTPMKMFSKRDQPPSSVVESTAPGSADFSSGKTLKNPEKTHLAYARWQEQINSPADARESYQRVLDKNPKSCDALLGLSRLEQLAGRHAEAEKYLQRAATANPDNPTVNAAYGLYYANQKDWRNAVAQLQEACRRNPDEPVFSHQLGVVLAKSGNSSAALAQFEKNLTPAEARYNLGYILHEQGRVAEAGEQLQAALQLNPDLTQAQQLLATMKREQAKELAQRSYGQPQRSAYPAQPNYAQQRVAPVGYQTQGQVPQYR